MRARPSTPTSTRGRRPYWSRATSNSPAVSSTRRSAGRRTWRCTSSRSRSTRSSPITPEGRVVVHRAGNDDTNFSSNQFQGLTLDDEAFVWECQQLLRDGTFDLVFYYEANVDQEALADDLAELDNVDRVTQVP